MKTFDQFIGESKINPIKVIDYAMSKPNLGLKKGKAFAKRSSSSAGGGSDGSGGSGDGGDGE